MKTNTKKYRNTLYALIALCLGIFNPLLAQAEKEQLLDRIVAIVDSDVILESSLNTDTAFVIKQLKKNGTPVPSINVMRKQVLERLIMEKLQLQHAERAGIRVDDLMLDQAVRDIASRNKLSLQQFRKELLADGLNYIQYREDIRKEMILSTLKQRIVNSRVIISEKEVDDYINSQQNVGADKAEYKLSHIMVSLPEAANPEIIKKAQEKAETIYQELKKGADFATLAISNSDGQNALEGGDLGWRKINQLPTLFAKTITTLNKNQFSKPIRSPSGFHILKLHDNRGVKRHYTSQVNARHILITTNAIVDDKTAREKLSDIKNRIIKGEKFSTLAKIHSEDPTSATRGGKLGWSKSSVYVPEFRKVLDSIPAKKISEPFQTKYGWHILEVLERREYDDTNQHKRKIAKNNIFQRKAAEEENLWLRQLRDQAYIEYRLDS